MSEAARRGVDLALTRPGEDRHVGHEGLHVHRPERPEAVVWFALRRDLWGQGRATEALRGVLRFGVEQLGVHRCVGDCDPRNLGSARAMETAGVRGEWR